MSKKSSLFNFKLTEEEQGRATDKMNELGFKGSIGLFAKRQILKTRSKGNSESILTAISNFEEILSTLENMVVDDPGLIRSKVIALKGKVDEMLSEYAEDYL